MANTTTAPVSKGNTAATTTPEMPIQTKHLAAKFKLSPVALRRILRSMKEYADGVHTNYRWAENDPRIARIELRIKELAAEKVNRAKAAKEALDARAAASAKQAQVDAKAGLVPAKA